MADPTAAAVKILRLWALAALAGTTASAPKPLGGLKAAATSVSRPQHRRGSACDEGTQLDADSLAEATAVVGEITAPAS